MNHSYKLSSLPLWAMVLVSLEGQAVFASPLESAEPATPATAASPAPPPAPVAVDPTVQKVEVTRSRSDERRTETGFKQVLGVAEITRYGDASVLDVLRRQPGIVVTGIPGRKGGEITLRGLGSGYVRILLNGEVAPAGFSLDNLAPDVVERIEILPVPSVELGTQAIAGSINVILKQGRGKQEKLVKAGLSHDGDRLKPRVSGTWSQQSGALSMLLTGAARVNGGDENYFTETRGVDQNGALLRHLSQFNQDRGWNWNLAPRFNLKLAGGNALSLQSFISQNHYDSRGYDRTQFIQGASNPFGNDYYSSRGDSQTLRHTLNWQHKLSESSQLEARLGASYVHRQRSSQIQFLDANQTATQRQHTRDDEDSRSMSGSAKLKTAYAGSHALVSGLEFQRDKEERRQFNQIDAVSQLDSSGTDFAINNRRYAFYTQDEWDVTPRWSLYLGARWEQTQLQSENNLGQRVSNRQRIFSPVLQTVWRLPDTRSDQLRFGLARTLRLPPAISLVAGRNPAIFNSATTPDTGGNPALKAETALGLDLAFEHYLEQDGLLSISIFSRRINNIILSQTRLQDGRWVLLPENSGQATSRGVEIEAKFKLSQWFAAAPPVRVRTGLNRAWSSIDAVPGPDNRIGSQAPLSFNLGLDHSFKATPLTLGANFALVKNSEVRLSAYEWSQESNSRSLESYLLWKLDAKTQLRVTASNLLRLDYSKGTRYLGPELRQQKSTITPTYAALRAELEWKL